MAHPEFNVIVTAGVLAKLRTFSRSDGFKVAEVKGIVRKHYNIPQGDQQFEIDFNIFINRFITKLEAQNSWKERGGRLYLPPSPHTKFLSWPKATLESLSQFIIGLGPVSRSDVLAFVKSYYTKYDERRIEGQLTIKLANAQKKEYIDFQRGLYVAPPGRLQKFLNNCVNKILQRNTNNHAHTSMISSHFDVDVLVFATFEHIPAADSLRNDIIASMLPKRQEKDLRSLNQAVDEFRALHQQPSARRERDLYDPDALKKDKPARVHDDDPRCGLSGLQKFDGEDLNGKARRKFQNEQARAWFEAQMHEKDKARQNQQEADRLYNLKQRELDQRAVELQGAERQCKKAIEMATATFNDALNNEHKERERLKQQQDLDDKLTEIANHVFGDILTENPAVAQSAFGPHRVIANRWKGMSPQELEAIRKEQELHRAENERLRQEEELRNREFERQASANARAALMLERVLGRRRRDMEKAQADENRRLAQEQKSHLDFLSKEVYTNSPTAAYFMQFNTTR